MRRRIVGERIDGPASPNLPRRAGVPRHHAEQSLELRFLVVIHEPASPAAP